MNPPQADEFSPFYATYINTVSENALGELEHQTTSFPEFLKLIPDDKAYYSYAEGKWTVKEVIGHVIDTERIMAYRALRIARNDQTPLASFDENDYVISANFNDRSLESLSNEFAALRRSNIYLFKHFSEVEFGRMGMASGNPVSVRALLYITVGHLNHHRKVIEERYI